jgi:hypothetical protein
VRARSILFALIALCLLPVTGAEAQRNQGLPYDAWCRDVQTGWGGSTMICRAFTYQQCMASRSSHVETCYLNPLYDPRFAEWRRRNSHY